mgnify:CR=1 FL=1
MIDILRKMTYGHYILTARKVGDELKTRDKDYIAAGTVNWATQTSFHPPMIAVAVEHDADLNETIDYSEHFTLQLLGEDNREMVNAFGTKSNVNGDEINGYPFKKVGGQAILQNTVGYVICEVKETVNAGDHRLYIGEVIDHKHDNNRPVIHTDSVAMQYAD